ncbi:MAG: DNA cytosine methyltransferase [Kouleothrix sp.]|nr:DNA cytosine methyltransferase [Kouleothrix sp.]
MKAIDLFSGAGGMSLGFERAGFQVLAAFDHDPKHIETYSTNFPTTLARTVDISKLTADFVYDLCGHRQDIDLVFGGPPCQGFSVGGRRDVDDSRNSLLLEFARVVRELQPKAFIAENVEGILGSKYHKIIGQFYAEMSQAGYQMPDRPLVLNAADFNVPQARRRVFFVGVRRGHRLPPPPIPVFASADHELRKPDVRAAISDIPTLNSFDYLYEHDRFTGSLGQPTLYSAELRKPRTGKKASDIGGFLRTRHSDSVLERFADTPAGSREPISRFYRLAWNGVAPTLRAGTTYAMGKYMAPRPIHPVEHRVITVREAARLHSYPDWFEFYATKWYGFMQVGNSVPPLLSEAVARSVIQSFG